MRMKKALAILVVLALAIGFVFATNDTLTMSVSIQRVVPAFNLYYNAGTAQTPSWSRGTNGVVTLSTCIADESVVANFAVKQEGEADNKTFSRYGTKGSWTAVELTVTCNEFFLYNGNTKDETTKSGTGAVSAAANGATVSNKLDYNDPVTSGNTVKFYPKYAGKKVDDQIVGTFTATWTKVDDLPVGTYKADITLTYTVN